MLTSVNVSIANAVEANPQFSADALLPYCKQLASSQKTKPDMKPVDIAQTGVCLGMVQAISSTLIAGFGPCITNIPKDLSNQQALSISTRFIDAKSRT
jgi:hypothetical protein